MSTHASNYIFKWTFSALCFRNKNRSELEEDGLRSLAGIETKEFLESNNMLPSNFRGEFEANGMREWFLAEIFQRH